MDAIRSGEKTQTIRLWKFAKMRAGQRSYIPGAGYIRIDAVDPVALESLTDADAVLDGFPSTDALRTEIRELYAEKITAGQQAFRIRFHILPADEQIKKPKPAKPSKK